MRVNRVFCVFVAALISILAAELGGSRAGNLLDLYRRAVEYDPVYRIAVQEREIAGETLRESKAGIQPTLNGDVQLGWTYQNIKESDNILFQPGTSDFFNNALSLSFSQPLYRKQALNRIRQAKAEVRQAVARFASAEQDLIYRLSEAEFDFLAARDDLEFAVAERRAIQQQLQETEERLASGLATMTDAHDARARFALAQTTEIDAGEMLEDRRLAIAEITGLAPDEVGNLSETLPLTRPEISDVEAWVQTALFQNPEVQAYEAAIEVAQREVDNQRAVRVPDVDFVMNTNQSNTGGSQFAGGGGRNILNTDLAIRATIPIFDGRVSPRVAGAALRHKIALQELEQAKRAIERETRGSYQRVLSSITRIEALTRSVFSYEAALAQKEEGLRAGIDTGLDVLDARRDLFRAKRELTQARYLYILNGLRLKRAAGSLTPQDLVQIDAYLD
jgi:outer membrane protein